MVQMYWIFILDVLLMNLRLTTLQCRQLPVGGNNRRQE